MFRSPPSSPPSSPATPWDSSLPSSPSISESSLPPSQRITDPLAASYNADHPKRHAPPVLFTPQPKRARDTAPLPTSQALQPLAPKSRSQADDLEHKIWEEASNNVFESGCRTIDLSDRQLTAVPAQFIHDLNKLVVLRGIEYPSIGSPLSLSSVKSDVITASGGRLFTRVQTAPTFSHSRGPSSRGKSISTNSLSSGNSKDAVQLFLAKNNFSKFPLTLSRLENLTLLSLHHNFISYLPPEVAQLKNLQSLNVCNNRLKFIPSELLEMKLHSLLLFPNPFLSPPPPPRFASETEYFASKVPSLTELALRILLAYPRPPKTTFLSPTPTLVPETLLEQRFHLPLPVGASWSPISPLLQRTLSICVPGSVPHDESLAMSSSEDQSMQITGIGKCPNPEHGQEKKVFVLPAEQRLTWERRIAGQDVGSAVPVRWRGCQRGCLDFLCPTSGTKFSAGQGEAAEANIEEFQAVQFGGLDFED